MVNRIHQVASMSTHLIHASWTHLSPHPERHLDRFSRSCTLTAESPYTLQWVVPFALKIAPSHKGIWSLTHTWFRGPTRVHNPNGILIGSAAFAGLTIVTDRPTD